MSRKDKKKKKKEEEEEDDEEDEEEEEGGQNVQQMTMRSVKIVKKNKEGRKFYVGTQAMRNEWVLAIATALNDFKDLSSEDSALAKAAEQKIRVNIIRARDLTAKDFGGKSDPYVVVEFENMGLKIQTEVKMKTLKPKWNEVKEVRIRDPEAERILLKVYDWDRLGKAGSLGIATVKLSELVLVDGKEVVKELRLEGGGEGRLEIGITSLGWSMN
eukprot:TRINITY_DN1166_c0_g1_i1.p1 TRINITY_DN1166_c0_g1~~TRINITY_DN1166_c0_g1_i1.p1  ORF type:complete len:215 (+),score=85.25 TRINITY_DN1166_c0_g1_i1:806-1450(+)